MRTGLHSGDTGCRRSHHLGSWHVCGTCCSLQHRRKQTISTAAIKRSDALNVSDVELFKAARQYSEELDEGKLTEDEIIAKIIGADSAEALTEVQRKYKDKLKAQIAKKAAELDQGEADIRRQYDIGAKLYGVGRYQESEDVLSQAMSRSAPFSRLGGEIQIQLALTKAANRKDDECIALLKTVEDTHPIKAVNKQAGDLKFIMEAPKLKVEDDEKLTLPSLSHIREKKNRRGPRAPAPKPPEQLPERTKSWEERFWENYSPPAYMRNRFVWYGLAVWSAYAVYWSVVNRDLIM